MTPKQADKFKFKPLVFVTTFGDQFDGIIVDRTRWHLLISYPGQTRPGVFDRTDIAEFHPL